MVGSPLRVSSSFSLSLAASSPATTFSALRSFSLHMLIAVMVRSSDSSPACSSFTAASESRAPSPYAAPFCAVTTCHSVATSVVPRSVVPSPPAASAIAFLVRMWDSLTEPMTGPRMPATSATLAGWDFAAAASGPLEPTTEPVSISVSASVWTALRHSASFSHMKMPRP